jgi:protein-tyrosine phosphatase
MKYVMTLFSAVALAGPAWAGEPAVQFEARQDESRFIVLEGGRNFRDVGGYRTEDGKTVKRGELYRSGSLGGLTLKGQLRLRELHIGSIVDLRTTQERSRDMSNWLAVSGQGYWTRDYGLSQGDAGAAFPDMSKLTAESVHAMMMGAYRTLPREQAPSYRELFARLANGKGPVVVNCTAGKDRTGIATALVLTALGVPYETVRQDFLLSNGAPGMNTLQADLSPPISRLAPEVVRPLIGVEGDYLDTAFSQIRQDYGSIDGYLQQELGVGPREIAAIRMRMLD